MSTQHEYRVPQWTRGDRMRKALEDQGFSIAEAARHFDVGRNTISNWIHDHTDGISKTEMDEWARWTRVPAAWLRTGVDSDGPSSGGGVTPPLVRGRSRFAQHAFAIAA